MRKFALLLSILFVVAAVTGAVAQSTPPSEQSAPAAKDAPPKAPGSPENGATEGQKQAQPSGNTDVKIDSRTEIKPAPSGEGSALPRAAGDSTTIFGLSPLAAAALGAALLVVVVLALVAMSRSSGDRSGI